MPHMRSEITLGNVLQIASILAIGVAGYVRLDEQSTSNEAAWAAAAASQAALELRVRILENDVARVDERYAAILGILTRIESRVERMEEERQR